MNNPFTKIADKIIQILYYYVPRLLLNLWLVPQCGTYYMDTNNIEIVSSSLLKETTTAPNEH